MMTPLLTCLRWVQVTYSGTGEPKPGDVTSVYSLRFEGSCPLASQGLLSELPPTGDMSKGTTASLAASMLGQKAKVEL